MGWSTEYGDPYPGDYELRCSNCDTVIKFNCDVIVKYKVKESGMKTKVGLPDSLRQAAADNDVEAFFKELDNYAVCGIIPIVVDYLNELLEKNPQSVHDLCEFRVPLQMSEDDPFPLKVTEVEGKEGLHFGLIGVINGLIEKLMGGNILVAGMYDDKDCLRTFQAQVMVSSGNNPMASLVPLARKTQEIMDRITDQGQIAAAGICEDPAERDDSDGHCSHCSNPVTDVEQMDNGGLCNECAAKDSEGQL